MRFFVIAALLCFVSERNLESATKTNIVVITNFCLTTNYHIVTIDDPLPPLPITPTGFVEGRRISFSIWLLGDKVSGHLIDKDGVRVIGDFQSGPNGLLRISFHPTHNTMRLYKELKGMNVDILMPAADNNWHTVIAECDSRFVKATFDNKPVEFVVGKDWKMDTKLFIGNDANGWATNQPGPGDFNLPIKDLKVESFTTTNRVNMFNFVDYVGNTSRPITGPTVHSGFHPYVKFCSWKDFMVTYNRYDEGRFPYKVFNINDPQKVLAVFGNDGQTLGGDLGKVPIEIEVEQDRFYAKLQNGQIEVYECGTWRKIMVGGGYFPSIKPYRVSKDGNRTASINFDDNTITVDGQKIGVSGGYEKDGGLVKNYKWGHYYYDGHKNLCGFVEWQPDGKLWVSDAATSRVIRYNSDLTQDGTVIQFIPHIYIASFDVNIPQRIFIGFLEFNYDYSNRDWKLVANWQPSENSRQNGYGEGLRYVTSLEDDRTVALSLFNNGPFKQLVEFDYSNYTLKETSHKNLHSDANIDEKGQWHYWKYENNNAIFAKFDFTTGREQVFDSIVYKSSDPIWTIRILPDGRDISVFQPSKDFVGEHLGLINFGQWKWKKSSTSTLNGKGTFDPWATYGSEMTSQVVIGDDIYYHYYGEFFRGSGQANQTIWFNKKGEFKGQFGQMAFHQTETAAPMSASNSKSISAVKWGPKTYVLLANEQSVGAQLVEKID